MGIHRRIVRLALAALVAVPGVLTAQGRQISGTVTKAGTGQPIPEAVVSVSGTVNSARTDGEGRFTVEAPAGEARVTVRAIGYTRKDAVVPAGQTTVNFVLDQDVFKLDEVVVSGQATTVERRNLTTSVGYVSGDDVSKVASATVESALYGKLAGVNIQGNGGAPGGGMQLQIRGSNTILGSFDPLYVVDGVIYSNARVLGGRAGITAGANINEDNPQNRLADLNPADIASIEVLKGAAAASIYGSKAANGVVVIKTLRGTSGNTRVNVSQRVGSFSILRAYENRCFTSAADAASAFGTKATDYLATLGGSIPCYDHYDQIWGDRPSLSYETVADVSGGTETTKYFASGTWKRDNAIEPGTGFARQGLRINVDQAIGTKFDLSLSSVFNRADNDRGWSNNCNVFACYGYAVAYIPSFVDLRRQANGQFINPAVAGGVSSNPLQTAALARNNTETYRFTGGLTLTWKALTTDQTSVRFIGSGGADLFSQYDELYTPNDLFFEVPQARPGSAVENSGNSRQQNWNLNGVWTQRTAPIGGIQFTTAAGIQYEDRRLQTYRVTTDNLVPGQRNIDQGTNVVVAEALTPERTLAFYGQEDVSLFDDRLLVSAGLRAERSSANGDISKYYVYPRVSAKYSFRDLLGVGSELKIRAAYGELGNQPNFGNKFTNLLTPQFGGQNGFQVSTVAGDPTIEPERVKEIEGGFDINFLNGRANLDVSGYDRRTTNLLLSRTPAPSTGFTSQIFNGGEIQNRGVEVVLGLTPVQTRDLSWQTFSSFTLHRSKVLSLPVPGFRPPSSGFGGLGVLFIEEGEPLTRVFGPLDANGNQGTIGDTEPDFRVGLQQSLTWKSVAFSVTADWQKGGTVTNLTQFLYDDGRTAADFGQPTHTARINDCYNTGNMLCYIEPADFFKLREVAVSWLLPTNVSQSIGIGIRDVRLSLTARDLFWSIKYSGLDSEVANFGSAAIRSNVDVSPYPPSRSIFFNVAVGF